MIVLLFIDAITYLTLYNYQKNMEIYSNFPHQLKLALKWANETFLDI